MKYLINNVGIKCTNMNKFESSTNWIVNIYEKMRNRHNFKFAHKWSLNRFSCTTKKDLCLVHTFTFVTSCLEKACKFCRAKISNQHNNIGSEHATRCKLTSTLRHISSYSVLNYRCSSLLFCLFCRALSCSFSRCSSLLFCLFCRALSCSFSRCSSLLFCLFCRARSCSFSRCSSLVRCLLCRALSCSFARCSL